MTSITINTFIAAPVSRCFDLSRSIDLHLLSTKSTSERAIAGVTTGLMNAGETVTWEAVHFGVKQQLTTRVATMDPPRYFCDQQVSGAFKTMHHEHHFESKDDGTLMTDVLVYETPYGLFGWIFDRLALKKHMRDFLQERNAVIKKVAEGNEWQRLLE